MSEQEIGTLKPGALGLALAAFAFVPVLVAAPLGTVALLVMASLFGIVARGGLGRPILLGLRPFALVLLVLLAWSALSTLWSIDRTLSIVETARMAGLAVVALYFLDAVGRLEHAAAAWVRTGFIAGLALALALLATAALLAHFAVVPADVMTRFNRASVITAILAGPAVAQLYAAGRFALAPALGVAILAVVLLLYGTTAKVALLAGAGVGVLVALAPRHLSRLAALLCVVAVVTAPLTFPKLATVPAINSDLMAVKNSAWHRAQIWHFVGDRISERPILGWGMNTARVIPGGKQEVAPGMEALPLHPHNDALQLWLELGVIGALALAAILGKLWPLVPDPTLPAVLIGGRAMALTAGLVALMVDYGVWQEWWLAALVLSAGFVMLDRGAVAARR